MYSINKCILLISSLLFFIGNIQAQNNKIDSLKNELENHKANDTTRVNLLNTLAFSYFSKDVNIAIQYIEEADSIAEITHFNKGKAKSLYIKGITEAVQSNFDQALYHYNEALKLYENIDFKEGIANCYNAMAIAYKNKGEQRESIVCLKKSISIQKKIGGKNLAAALINLGSIYQDLGEFDEALLYLKKALTTAKADQNEQRVAYSLNNLGTIYMDQGNYPLALEYYRESLYINEKLGDSLGIVNNLLNMGIIYKTQKYFDKAMEYYEKSLEINKRINRKQGIASLLNDIGTLHEENEEYRKALDHYVQALNISKEIGAKRDIPNILNNIGGVYLVLKDYSSANQYFTEAEKISLDVESKKTLCEAYIGLARTYMNQKEHNIALNNALKAKGISKTSGFLDVQKEALEILSKIYKARGNYKDALESYHQFKILNDSLFNKENIEKITQLEYEYKYKQELDSASIRELKLTKTVNMVNQNLEKSQRNLLLGVIGFLIIALVLGAIIFFLRLKNEKSKTQNIAIEQKLLRSQMTPHFIFNSLSVLQGMILNKDDKKSVTYLSKFSKLLRITLENSRDKLVSMEQELMAVENYLALQNIETEHPFNFKIDIDSRIDKTLFLIPPMLIQPFVENAIEHGFVGIKENKQISILLFFQNKQLSCIIKDNGVGVEAMKPSLSNTKKSLSTTISQERLQMLSKEFKMDSYIKVEDRKKYNEQGTIVTLILPYKIIEA